MPWLPEPHTMTTGMAHPLMRASEPAAARARARQEGSDARLPSSVLPTSAPQACSSPSREMASLSSSWRSRGVAGGVDAAVFGEGDDRIEVEGRYHLVVGVFGIGGDGLGGVVGTFEARAVEPAIGDDRMMAGDDDVGGVLGCMRAHADVEVGGRRGRVRRSHSRRVQGGCGVRARSSSSTDSSTSSALAAFPPTVPSVAAASSPASPPELGTVTLFTFLMMLPEQSRSIWSGSQPSVSRASAAA